MDRTSAILSAKSASRGRCCESWIDGARVLMALNGPATAVPGFGSKVSRWLGPPLSQRTMHAVAAGARAAGAESACASRPEKACERRSPKKLLPPTARNRRLSHPALLHDLMPCLRIAQWL